MVYGVLLKPLPFARARAPGQPGTPRAARRAGSEPRTRDLFTYRENQRAFEEIGAWDTGRGLDHRPRRAGTASRRCWSARRRCRCSRVQPVARPALQRGRRRARRPLRVILTYGYWQRRFGGAADVVGQTHRDRRQARRSHRRAAGVVQVPAHRSRDRAADAARSRRRAARHQLRLSGAGAAEAGRRRSRRPTPTSARMISLLPPAFAQSCELRPNVRPLADDVIGDIGHVLWMLLAAVGIVLLIACGNVANLFLVRAEGAPAGVRAARGARREPRPHRARAALGKRRCWRSPAASLGLALAQAASACCGDRAGGAAAPRRDRHRPDRPALHARRSRCSAACCSASFRCCDSARPSIAALKEGGRSASDGPARHRTRNALVVAQIALALVLLIVSGLMIRTFVAMRQVDPGFTHPEDVQTFRIAMPASAHRRIRSRRRARTSASPSASRRCRASPPSASRRRSRWTARTTATPIFVEDFPTPEGTIAAAAPLQVLRAGLFRDDGQSGLVAGRALTWDDMLRAAAGGRHLRDARARVLEGAGARRSASASAATRAEAVAGDRRRGRRRARRRPESAGDRDRLLADAERELSAGARWPTPCARHRVGTPGFLRELQQAVWSVNPNLPLPTRADARRDPGAARWRRPRSRW